MSNNNSYKIDAFLDPKREALRLRHRDYARLECLIPALVALGLKRNSRVLDIGSGTGVRTATIAEYVIRGQVVGLDFSAMLRTKATQHIRSRGFSNVELIDGDILDPPSSLGTFDLIHMRLVVQHLDDPLRALRNCHRLLKRNGTIFIEDTDREWMTLYPSPRSWERAYEVIKAIQKKKGGDPVSGRKLASYLGQAGFSGVQSNMVPVTGSSATIREWLKYYAPTYFSNMKPDQARRHLKSLSDIEEQLRSVPTYFHQVWFQAYGTKR